jgi:hypothetical protein
MSDQESIFQNTVIIRLKIIRQIILQKNKDQILYQVILNQNVFVHSLTLFIMKL